jgi:hypothetical protein
MTLNPVGFIDKGVHFMGHIMPLFRPEGTAVMQDILVLDGTCLEIN